MVPASDLESVRVASASDDPAENAGQFIGMHASPVHALQARLERFESEQQATDSHGSPPRGWRILAWPAGLSLGLWLVIIEVIRAVLSKFVA